MEHRDRFLRPIFKWVTQSVRMTPLLKKGRRICSCDPLSATIFFHQNDSLSSLPKISPLGSAPSSVDLSFDGLEFAIIVCNTILCCLHCGLMYFFITIFLCLNKFVLLPLHQKYQSFHLCSRQLLSVSVQR